MEDRKHNKLIGIVIILSFTLFSALSFVRLVDKKEEIRAKEQYELVQQQELLKQQELEKQNQEKVTPTPTPSDDLIENDISIDRISNYKLSELSFNLNGADCGLPYTVASMVSYGYLFRDKIVNEQGNNYTYNQLSEVLPGKSYSDFIETLSPGNQIVSILIKNSNDNEQPMQNCDVYGISASSCYYGNYGKDIKDPTFEFSNGVYLGMSEGELIKIMGHYDKKFYVDEEEKIARYQWYESLDGQSINNIMTCDVIGGVVHMLSIEY